MEGSGLGLSGLILARGMVQRTPLLLLMGHADALGGQFDYHAPRAWWVRRRSRASGFRT